MPDLRTLLHDATEHPPAPDPVGAVHRRVRRRAVRRGATVTAGAALASVAALAVFAAGGTATPSRPGPAASGGSSGPPGLSTVYDRGWRISPDEQGPVRIHESLDRVLDLVDDNRDTFVGVSIRVGADAGNSYVFAFSRDVDRAEWTDDIEQAVGDRPWQTTQCPDTAADLDRMATEVLSAPWPSGTQVKREDGERWAVSYTFPCTVVATVSAPYADGRDVEYARERWGGAVVVRGSDEADL